MFKASFHNQVTNKGHVPLRFLYHHHLARQPLKPHHDLGNLQTEPKTYISNKESREQRICT